MTDPTATETERAKPLHLVAGTRFAAQDINVLDVVDITDKVRK